MTTGQKHLARFIALIGVALVGLAVARLFDWKDVEHAPLYMLTASVLLFVGIYAAVYTIDKADAKQHKLIIILALTVGVFAKYALIAIAMFGATHHIEYAVLAMAVAQIDPLSIAALEKDQRMTTRTKTILKMWASFDDPVTAVATPLMLRIFYGSANGMVRSQSAGDVFIDLLPFIITLVLVGGLALLRRIYDDVDALRARYAQSEGLKRVLLLLVMGVVVSLRTFSVAAIAGWFIRPAVLEKKGRSKWLPRALQRFVSQDSAIIDRLVTTALWGAVFMLGLLLANGVNPREGSLLGVFTYLAHFLVAFLVVGLAYAIDVAKAAKRNRVFASKLRALVEAKEQAEKNEAKEALGVKIEALLELRMIPKNTEDLRWREIVHLALAQQNGITAIILALNLEPVIDGAVATISMAIVTINVLNFVGNALFHKFFPDEDSAEAKATPVTS